MCWHDGLGEIRALLGLHEVLRWDGGGVVGDGGEGEGVAVGEDVEGVEGAGVVEELEPGEDDYADFGGEGGVGLGGRHDGVGYLDFWVMEFWCFLFVKVERLFQ